MCAAAIGWALVPAAAQAQPSANADRALAEPEAQRAKAPTPLHQDPAQASASATAEPWVSPALSPLLSLDMGLSWLPPAVAVMPGVFVHGAGHWVMGHRDTAIDLMLLEAGGVVMMGAASGLIGPTGASRKLISFAYPLALSGFALFSGTWLADIYGTLSHGREVGARTDVPNLNVRAGYLHVYDPQFHYRNFAVVGVDLNAAFLRLSPTAWVAADDANRRLRAELAVRLGGPRADKPARLYASGSSVDVFHATMWHDFDSDGFELLTFEFGVQGRYDMAHMAETLRGSFADMRLGWGLQIFDFDHPDLEFGSDTSDMLLMRIGYGLYLDERGLGEVQFFYDHRRDDFPGSITIIPTTGGILGFHIGTNGRYPIAGPWGVTWEAAMGSAYTGLLGVTYRYDDPEVSDD